MEETLQLFAVSGRTRTISWSVDALAAPSEPDPELEADACASTGPFAQPAKNRSATHAPRSLRTFRWYEIAAAIGTLTFHPATRRVE